MAAGDLVYANEGHVQQSQRQERPTICSCQTQDAVDGLWHPDFTPHSLLIEAEERLMAKLSLESSIDPGGLPIPEILITCPDKGHHPSGQQRKAACRSSGSEAESDLFHSQLTGAIINQDQNIPRAKGSILKNPTQPRPPGPLSPFGMHSTAFQTTRNPHSSGQSHRDPSKDSEDSEMALFEDDVFSPRPGDRERPLIMWPSTLPPPGSLQIPSSPPDFARRTSSIPNQGNVQEARKEGLHLGSEAGMGPQQRVVEQSRRSKKTNARRTWPINIGDGQSRSDKVAFMPQHPLPRPRISPLTPLTYRPDAVPGRSPSEAVMQRHSLHDAKHRIGNGLRYPDLEQHTVRRWHAILDSPATDVSLILAADDPNPTAMRFESRFLPSYLRTHAESLEGLATREAALMAICLHDPSSAVIEQEWPREVQFIPSTANDNILPLSALTPGMDRQITSQARKRKGDDADASQKDQQALKTEQTGQYHEDGRSDEPTASTVRQLSPEAHSRYADHELAAHTWKSERIDFQDRKSKGDHGVSVEAGPARKTCLPRAALDTTESIGKHHVNSTDAALQATTKTTFHTQNSQLQDGEDGSHSQGKQSTQDEKEQSTALSSGKKRKRAKRKPSPADLTWPRRSSSSASSSDNGQEDHGPISKKARGMIAALQVRLKRQEQEQARGRSKGKLARANHRGASTTTASDPSYRPGVEEAEDEDATEQESIKPADVKREIQGRAKVRAHGSKVDAMYRPAHHLDDDDDDDAKSPSAADVARETAGGHLRKRKRPVDAAYKPGHADEDDDPADHMLSWRRTRAWTPRRQGD